MASTKIGGMMDDDLPMIISLQDTIDLIVRKYGPDWRKYPYCVMTVIWAAKLFEESHIREIVPDLTDICLEYKKDRKMNGKKFPDNIPLLALAVVDPNYPKIEMEE